MGTVKEGAFHFAGAKITDQKRLVRAEQYLAARTALRARDHVHHARWRVLIMAGAEPLGEIKTIRELMPKAHITAVDRDGRCLAAAIDAGVDEVVQCDIAHFTGRCGQLSRGPAIELRDLEKFDLICLDLCGGATPENSTISRVYRRMVTNKGVFIFTFSYGRDVIEAIRQAGLNVELAALRDSCPNDLVLRRISYLFQNRVPDSIMLYRGASMPMCSVAFNGLRGWRDSISFVQIEPGDFELAVAYPEAANLYDCPQERIDALRRKFAAIKASLTRLAKSEVLPFQKDADG